MYRVLTDPASAGILTYNYIKDHPKYKLKKRMVRGLILILLIVAGVLVYTKETPFAPGEHHKTIKQSFMSMMCVKKQSRHWLSR